MFQYCEENDGQLAEIWSKGKQKEVYKFMGNIETTDLTDEYWIGKSSFPKRKRLFISSGSSLLG